MRYRPGEISVRELRANLKEYLDATDAVIIGDRWNVRAILVPMPLSHWSNRKEANAANSRAKKRFTDALRRAWPLR